MAYTDADIGKLDSCCEGCHRALLGTVVDLLVSDLDSDTAYSGDLLTATQIAELSGMCESARLSSLGTIVNNILTASQNYTEVDAVSDTVKNYLNSPCISFSGCTLGTILQNAAVTVNTMTEYDEAVLKTFLIGEVEGTIDEELKTVAIELPFGTAVTALVATFTISVGGSAYVGETLQESAVTENDFTNPVEYEIVGGDGSTTETYTVTVTVAAE